MALAFDNVLITVLDNFAKLLPFRIIHDYEQAVRYTFGHAGRTMHGTETGWCLFLPLIQNVDIIDVTWGQVRLDSQSVETKDKMNLSISGAVVYRVADARDYLLCVSDDDAAATLRAVAKGCVTSVLLDSNLDDVCSNRKQMQDRIAQELQKEVAE